MKLYFCFLLSAFCFASFASDKINILVPARYIGDAAVSRQPLTLTGTAPLPRTYYTNVFSRQPIARYTDTNGDCTFSNILWGYYRLDIPGAPGTSFNLVVGTNLTGTVNVVVLITNAGTMPPNPATNYYTQAQMDAIVAGILVLIPSGSAGASLAEVRAIVQTNAVSKLSNHVAQPFDVSRTAMTVTSDSHGYNWPEAMWALPWWAGLKAKTNATVGGTTMTGGNANAGTNIVYQRLIPWAYTNLSAGDTWIFYDGHNTVDFINGLINATTYRTVQTNMWADLQRHATSNHWNLVIVRPTCTLVLNNSESAATLGQDDVIFDNNNWLARYSYTNQPQLIVPDIYRSFPNNRDTNFWYVVPGVGADFVHIADSKTNFYAGIIDELIRGVSAARPMPYLSMEREGQGWSLRDDITGALSLHVWDGTRTNVGAVAGAIMKVVASVDGTLANSPTANVSIEASAGNGGTAPAAIFHGQAGQSVPVVRVAAAGSSPGMNIWDNYIETDSAVIGHYYVKSGGQVYFTNASTGQIMEMSYAAPSGATPGTIRILNGNMGGGTVMWAVDTNGNSYTRQTFSAQQGITHSNIFYNSTTLGGWGKADDIILCDGTNTVLTLSTAVGLHGQDLTFINVNSWAWQEIRPFDSSQKINGRTNFVLHPWQSVTLRATNSVGSLAGWFVESSHLSSTREQGDAFVFLNTNGLGFSKVSTTTNGGTALLNVEGSPGSRTLGYSEIQAILDALAYLTNNIGGGAGGIATNGGTGLNNRWTNATYVSASNIVMVLPTNGPSINGDTIVSGETSGNFAFLKFGFPSYAGTAGTAQTGDTADDFFGSGRLGPNIVADTNGAANGQFVMYTNGSLKFGSAAGSGDALTSGTLAQFAPTTSAQLRGVITDETGGVGVLVFNQAPSFGGVVSAEGLYVDSPIVAGFGMQIDAGTLDGDISGGTNINGSNIASGTVPPARLGSGSSITTKFLRGDSTWQTIPGGGDALTTSSLAQFAATTSAELGGVISDETGSGKVVFNTSPSFNSASNYGNAFSSIGSVYSSEQFGQLAIAANNFALAVGYGAVAVGDSSVAVGVSASATGALAVAVGPLSRATNGNSVAIGNGAHSDHDSSTALGYAAQTTAANQVRLGISGSDVSVPGTLSVAGSESHAGIVTNSGGQVISGAYRISQTPASVPFTLSWTNPAFFVSTNAPFTLAEVGSPAEGARVEMTVTNTALTNWQMTLPRNMFAPGTNAWVSTLTIIGASVMKFQFDYVRATNFVTGTDGPNNASLVRLAGYDGGGLTNIYATNIVVSPTTVLASSGNSTNYTVPLLPGPSGNLLQIYTANTNVYIRFTGTNIEDAQRTIWLRGLTNTVTVTVGFDTGFVITNANFNAYLTNATAKFINFYNIDTTGTNVVVSDGGRSGRY